MTRLLAVLLLAAAALSTALTGTTCYPVAYEVHYTASTTTVECRPAGSTPGDNPMVTSMRRVPSEDWSCIPDESTTK